MGAREELKEKQVEYVLKSSEYQELLKEITKNIINNSKESSNEASTAAIFELELYGFLRETLCLRYYPEKESLVERERHTAKGRIDSKLGVLLTEYKYHEKLNSVEKVDKATNQLKEYMEGLYVKDNSLDYLGIITDGICIRFVRLEKGIFFEESLKDIEPQDIDRLIKAILSLEKVALNSRNLVEDFKLSEGKLSKNLSKAFYDALLSNKCDKTNMLFEEWKELFKLSHEDKSKQKPIQERRAALEDALDRKFHKGTDEEYKAMFAIQTTYAIIVKTIALKVISNIYFNKSNNCNFYELALSESDGLKLKMQSLEDGDLFKDLGFTNLLEGDFFSWYATDEQWDDDKIGSNIKIIFAILTKYEDKSIFTEVDNIHDLFKDLYMNIMPDKVRHSLGEFYTVPWLADSVIDSALKNIKNKKWKGLDPCGGSGTFVTRMIAKIIGEFNSANNEISKVEVLKEVLERVKAIDLNPLAVLTLRVNYFINISSLIDENTDGVEIPVYLGDSAAVPESIKIDGVECIDYTIKTLKRDIEVKLPLSALKDVNEFSSTMNELELDIRCSDLDGVKDKIVKLIPENERTQEILNNINLLADTLIYLQENNWNGIWVRIIKNYLITATLGNFDIIVGNPPWVDWKNLPMNYREKIKTTVCIDNSLFSGANRTGGINLNICALISNVVCNKWLDKQGTLAILMPKSLIYQPSYEGFRKFSLKNGERLYLQEIYDWTESGHPFNPVKEKFLTYVYNRTVVNYREGISVTKYKIRKEHKLEKAIHVQEMNEMNDWFNVDKLYAGEAYEGSTTLSYADDKNELAKFQSITGVCSYKGREGIEFYPQELFLLNLEESMSEKNNCIFLKNYQGKGSKYKIPVRIVKLEKDYIHPLVRGREIEKYNWSGYEYCVPFPYEEGEKIPMPLRILNKKAPSLAKYLISSKSIIENQTDYNDKIINDSSAEFYALARVGKYTFADYSVVYRDNTKWRATVIERIDTEWGKNVRPLFQNHAVSITQNREGEFISKEEAYYICAIFNAPVVVNFIENSSDSRSFKIDPPIYVPKFDINNENHKKLYELSLKAHESYNNKALIKDIDKEIDRIYLEICKAKTH